MRLLSFAVLAFAACVLASDSPTSSDSCRSAPFNLIVLSSNSTLNGTHLFACHEGAAVKALCTNSSRYLRQGPNPPPLEPSIVRFFQNHTTKSRSEEANKTGYAFGELTWDFPNMPHSLGMKAGLQDKESNVLVPVFLPTNVHSNLITFDKEDKLFVWTWSQKESVSKNTAMNREQKAFYDWYICMTDVGYKLETVAWLEDGKSNNPSCQKVDIKKIPEGSLP
ncbi:uncharacterized protein RAG0_06643 [Rhynchosporium agropyri]|uniref:DUF7907 domain-containing protein n=1 Tax=Rhynchosporium agropyri TaxID=914238 RepID=A0A1E1KI78_9HELO|nr:uncharacterized protein RAG0_06643 [Rhynchosporium agropyri]